MPESTKENATQSNSLPTGMVSFLYNAFYDPATTRLCQNDIQAALSNFKITNSNPAYDILSNISQGGSGDAVADISVFDECIKLISGQYTGSELDRKLNALILAREILTECGTKSTILW